MNRYAMLPPQDCQALHIPLPQPPVIHPESKLAHQYLDGLTGIEIGAAAYQPFGVDAINVAPEDIWEQSLYQQIQMRVCGYYRLIDVYGEANCLPFDAESQDFIIASHVIEHVPNPIGAFLEWKRVLKPGGLIFMIFPKRDAPYGDEKREYTSHRVLQQAYVENWTDDIAFEQTRPNRRRGHYWVFNLASMCALTGLCNNGPYHLGWDILECEETDDTDQTGHMIVYQQGDGYDYHESHRKAE